MRPVYTQLEDGQVPSFEQFKSIKEKIIKSNNNIGFGQSMLKTNDLADKTL